MVERGGHTLCIEATNDTGSFHVSLVNENGTLNRSYSADVMGPSYKWMADGIRPEGETDFADEIMALPVREDGMVDVTSVFGGIRDFFLDAHPELEIDEE